MGIINTTALFFLILINLIIPVANEQCSAGIEGNGVVSVDPYRVREIGGEQLVIDLPCQSEQIDERSVKCKFQSYPENILDGIKLGDSQVACVTPTHIYLGTHEVYVSVDNGSSFGYVGSYFAVSEDLLVPFLGIQDLDPSAILFDFTTALEITITWNESIIPSQFLALNLMMIPDPFVEILGWDDSTVLINNVENTGILTFILSDVAPNTLIGFDTIPIAYGRLKLSATNTQLYIAGPTMHVTFSKINDDVCDLFVPILEQLPVEILQCPCTTLQAKIDENYHEEPPINPFYHPGVATCFRSVPSTFGSSAQCCYNANGSINLGTSGSGTSDTFSNEYSTTKHYVFDVLPWFVCCRIFGRCVHYYNYRTSDDCSTYRPVYFADG